MILFCLLQLRHGDDLVSVLLTVFNKTETVIQLPGMFLHMLFPQIIVPQIHTCGIIIPFAAYGGNKKNSFVQW